MRKTREPGDLRPLTIITDFCPAADGSVLIAMGNTRVICAASVDTTVPAHAEARGTGWISAEYTMLPYATSPRSGREFLKRDGRSVEIQRLIGRSLRGIVDLSLLRGYAIQVDCDVLQADGGTRTAAITGAAVALHRACHRLVERGAVPGNPATGLVAAVSAGYVDGHLLLDLDYEEDRQAAVDMNFVMDSSGLLIEVQGTGERTGFSRDQLDSMVALAMTGIGELFDIQRRHLVP